MLFINITKQLNHFSLIINHQFELKGITAILGASGSGKSTLINLINGLLNPEQGSILINNTIIFDAQKKQKLPIEKRNIATVFQDPLLFPHLTVKKNLLYGVKNKKNITQFDMDTIVTLLDIEPILHRYPAALSGGEKQRVAIGRALLSEPTLLLMDEPLSSLDSNRKRELIGYILKISSAVNLPIFYVTHNINEVTLLADKIAIIEQGRIIDYGEKASVLLHPSLQNWL